MSTNRVKGGRCRHESIDKSCDCAFCGKQTTHRQSYAISGGRVCNHHRFVCSCCKKTDLAADAIHIIDGKILCLTHPAPNSYIYSDGTILEFEYHV